MKPLHLVLPLMIASALLTGADMRCLSLHVAVPAGAEPPVPDGKTDDPCWAKAPVFRSYTKYMDKKGTPGTLKTESRLVYTEKGIFLAIDNFCADPRKIRRTITTGGQSEIWKDDCAEIYFNALCDDVSFVRCAVNSAGVFHSMSRDATLILQPDNQMPGTRIQCSIGKDRWSLEGFFPWEDLKGMARPGDLWRFCHVRYAWPDDKFQGESSSVNGSFYHPENFGYLYFAPRSAVRSGEIGEVLHGKVSGYWGLEWEGKILMSDDKGFRTEDATLLAETAEREFRTLAESVAGEAKTGLKKGKKELEALCSTVPEMETLKQANPVMYVLMMSEKNRALEEIRWSLKLEKEFE